MARIYGHEPDTAARLTEIAKAPQDVGRAFLRPQRQPRTIGGGGGELFRFSLNAAMSSNAADADIIEMDGTDTGTDVEVEDPEGIFSTLGSNARGLCMLQDGVYYIIQAACPA